MTILQDYFATIKALDVFVLKGVYEQVKLDSASSTKLLKSDKPLPGYLIEDLKAGVAYLYNLLVEALEASKENDEKLTQLLEQSTKLLKPKKVIQLLRDKASFKEALKVLDGLEQKLDALPSAEVEESHISIEPEKVEVKKAPKKAAKSFADILAEKEAEKQKELEAKRERASKKPLSKVAMVKERLNARKAKFLATESRQKGE